MAERPFAEEKRSLADRLRPVWTLAMACFRADPRRALTSVGLRFLSALAYPLFAVLVARLADHASGGSSAGLPTAGVALLLGAAVAAHTVLDEIAWKVVQMLEERTGHHVDCEVIGLVAGLPGIEHVERPEHLDKVDRLREEQWLIAQAVPALTNWGVLLFMAVSTLGTLATVDARFLLLPVAAVPGIWAAARAERIRRRYLDANSADFRLWHDFLRLATDQASGKEIRVFGLGQELIARHGENIDRISGWEQRHRLIGAGLMAAGRAVFVVAFVGAVLLVASDVTAGRAPVGDLVLTVVLAGQVLGLVRWAGSSTAWLTWTLTAVRRWVWLLDYADRHRAAVARAAGDARPGPPPDRLEEGIRLEGVGFRYPGTEVDVLAGVDLHLPAGATVALVGDNGAGKTTLVKLLCRFYEPSEGVITVDGRPLGGFDVEAWRARLSAAFQDHAPFELLVRDSVTLGDLSRLGDEEAALEALDRAGSLDVLDALPAGLDTQLGPRWPGGVDLSGGQWQKLSLARGMLRDDPLLLVLDEPTAALDAETEHRLFDRYAARARLVADRAGTITVLVSHRFSTVRMADLIVVVAGGRVAETGHHDDLMGAGGLYAELFSMQARAYR